MAIEAGSYHLFSSIIRVYNVSHFSPYLPVYNLCVFYHGLYCYHFIANRGRVLIFRIVLLITVPIKVSWYISPYPGDYIGNVADKDYAFAQITVIPW